MKIKICFVLPKHWTAMMGGSQLQAKFILDTIRQDSRFDIYYLTGEWDRSFRPKGYRIIPISRPKIFGRKVSFLEYLSLYRQLKEINPDVIYQRVGMAYTGIAAFYCQNNHCSMVWHVSHDSDVMPMKKIRSINFRQGWAEKLLVGYGLRHCSKIIVQTKRQADDLEKYFHRKPFKVVPNFHPACAMTPLKNETITIAWIANMKKWKQPQYFIKLAQALSERNIDVHCIMIGKPAIDRSWQKAIELKTAQCNNLTYMGEQPIETVNQILSKAHIFVNTSLAEGFANTVIQAWMRRVPVVSLCCSFDNVLDREQIGFFAKSFDTLVEKVAYLVENDTVRQEMGNRAKEYAQNVHSLKNIEQLRTIFLDKVFSTQT